MHEHIFKRRWPLEKQNIVLYVLLHIEADINNNRDSYDFRDGSAAAACNTNMRGANIGAVRRLLSA